MVRSARLVIGARLSISLFESEGQMVEARLHFETAIEDLRELLEDTGSKVEETIDLAVRSYFMQEPRIGSDTLELSNHVSACVHRVDEIILQLLSSKLLTPTDMRHLIAYVKVNALLEQIASLAVHTSDLSLSYNRIGVDWPTNVPRLSVAVCGQLRNALQALLRTDVDLAEAVLDSSSNVALMGNDAWVKLVERMKPSPESIPHALSAILIVRNLEAVGEHAKSTAGWILFWIDGNGARTCHIPNGSQSLAATPRSKSFKQEIG